MEAHKANSPYNLIQGFRRIYGNKSRLHLISLYILQNTIFTSNKSILIMTTLQILRVRMITWFSNDHESDRKALRAQFLWPVLCCYHVIIRRSQWIQRWEKDWRLNSMESHEEKDLSAQFGGFWFLFLILLSSTSALPREIKIYIVFLCINIKYNKNTLLHQIWDRTASCVFTAVEILFNMNWFSMKFGYMVFFIFSW